MIDEKEILDFADMVDEIADTDPDYGRKKFFRTKDSLKSEVLSMIVRIEEIDNIMPDVDRKTKGELSVEKGLILEKITEKILGIRNLFRKHERVLCKSNEIDFVMQPATNCAIYHRLLPECMKKDFLIECKNHKKAVDVTLVGKFYSLIKYKSAKFGIMVTNMPLTGDQEWDAAVGLTKKLNLADKVIIINITLSEIKDALETDKIFIEVIKEKIDKLIYHTEFRDSIHNHPAEALMIEVK